MTSFYFGPIYIDYGHYSKVMDRPIAILMGKLYSDMLYEAHHELYYVFSPSSECSSSIVHLFVFELLSRNCISFLSICRHHLVTATAALDALRFFFFFHPSSVHSIIKSHNRFHPGGGIRPSVCMPACLPVCLSEIGISNNIGGTTRPALTHFLALISGDT